MTTGHSNKKLAAAEFRRLVDRNISNQLEALRETPPCRVPGAYGKTPKAHGKPFAMCRTRQPGIGKAGLCRVLYIGHTVKGLPCATIDPRQKKSRHPGMITWPGLCRVLVDVAHGKVQMFAVCLGFGTR